MAIQTVELPEHAFKYEMVLLVGQESDCFEGNAHKKLPK